MPLRVLYVVPCWPAGKAFGTRLRVRQVGSALRTLGAVDTVVVTAEDPSQESGDTDAVLPVRDVVRLHPVTNRSVSNRLRCGFDPTFVDHHGRHVEPRDRTKFLDRLRHYDVIWIYQLSTADAFGQWRWPRSVLDFNDVPSTVLETTARHGASALERFRARVRLPVARQRERLARSRFTTLCVCSDTDAAGLGMNGTVHVIPNGFPRPDGEPERTPSRPPRIGFVGTFDYPPNADGVRWFIERCWSAIRLAHPGVRLRLIGTGVDHLEVAAGREMGVDRLGWVEDTESEIATWSMMIVPLRLGGGTRVKIAEGLSRKCPIVSTSFGAEGYGARSGREMLLSDTPSDFAAACLGLLQEPVRAAAMARRGWDAFLARWTWEAIEPAVSRTVDDCLRRESRLQPKGPSCAGF